MACLWKSGKSKNSSVLFQKGKLTFYGKQRCGGFKETHYKLEHTFSEWNCDLEPLSAQSPWGPRIADKEQTQTFN